jgi:hypothetical protein
LQRIYSFFSFSFSTIAYSVVCQLENCHTEKRLDNIEDRVTSAGVIPNVKWSIFFSSS